MNDISAARKTSRRLKSFLLRISFLRKRGEGMEEMPVKVLSYLDRSMQLLRAAIDRKSEAVRREPPPARDLQDDGGGSPE